VLAEIELIDESRVAIVVPLIVPLIAYKCEPETQEEMNAVEVKRIVFQLWLTLTPVGPLLIVPTLIVVPEMLHTAE
jgi:hypothetical protein